MEFFGGLLALWVADIIEEKVVFILVMIEGFLVYKLKPSVFSVINEPTDLALGFGLLEGFVGFGFGVKCFHGVLRLDVGILYYSLGGVKDYFRFFSMRVSIC